MMSNQKIKSYTGDNLIQIEEQIANDMKNYEIVTMTSLFVPINFNYHCEVIVVYKEIE